MARAIVGLVLAFVIAAGAWLLRTHAHPEAPATPSRGMIEGGKADPPSEHAAARAGDDRASSASDSQRDKDIAARLGNVRAMQTRLSGIVDAYCAAHHAMPARVEDISIPDIPGSFLVDRIELRNGTIALHLPVSELLPAGTIDDVPTLDGACAREWQCQSADFEAIATWIPGCRFVGASSRS